MAAINRKVLIFPTYGESIDGENGCVMKASFTSSSDIGGGTLVGDDTAGAVFNAAGYFPNELSGVSFNTTAVPEIATLNTTGFTLGMEMSADMFREDFTSVTRGIEYYFRLLTGLELYISHGNATARARARAYDHAGVQGAQDFDFYGYGNAGEMIPVLFTGGNGYFRSYVNGLIWHDVEWKPTGAGTTLVVGAGTGVASRPGIQDGSIRNVFLYDRPLNTANSRFLVALGGDSLGDQGTYPSAAGNHVIEALAVDGNAEAGFTVGSATVGQTSIASVLHAKMALAGINPSANRIQHWSVGGMGVIHNGAGVIAGLLSERVTTAISGLYPIPYLWIHLIGTNDLADTSALPTAQITDDTWRDAYQTEIDRLAAAGVQKQIVINMHSRTDATYLAIADRVARLEEMNAQILELTSVDAVVDAFTILGGYSIDGTHLSDGTHYTNVGQAKLAEEGVFPAVISVL